MQGLTSSQVMMVQMLEMPKNAFKNNPLTQKAEETAKNLLKAELRRRGITYAGLVDLLAEAGVQETERNLTNKISRGGFTAAFMVQCLMAIGCKTLPITTE
jgi:hypothetical protein